MPVLNTLEAGVDIFQIFGYTLRWKSGVHKISAFHNTMAKGGVGYGTKEDRQEDCQEDRQENHQEEVTISGR
ncbi:MAG: hypothetical protein RUDDFDWM_001013 [Candidatus Fervidibacterota bacterium]